MKILKKEMVIKRRQYEHTLSERRILENIDHPFIVSLRFAFQVRGGAPCCPWLLAFEQFCCMRVCPV